MEQTPPAARTMMATRMRNDPALEALKDELDRLLSQRFDIEPVKKEMFEAPADFMRQMRPFGPASRGGT